MPYPCFLVEAVNPRVVRHQCDEAGCDCGGWDESTLDVRRVDDGEIIATNVTYIGENLPAGAMWWQDCSTSQYPTGPADWSGVPESNRSAVRLAMAQHPDWYAKRGQLDPEGAGRLADPVTGMPWREPSHLFADGPHLEVMTPGGVWNIDSRASNCGRPYDYSHRCWVRHGDAPGISVDKAGETCAAGGGSIQCGGYHGFLTEGGLTDG